MLKPFARLRAYWIENFRRQVRPGDQGRARITARSIYILPTRHGIVMAAVLVLMLIGSVNYANNLGYLITFLLGGIWLTAILHTWRNLLGLRVLALKAQPVFAGEDALFHLQLDNPGGLARFGIKVMASNQRFDLADIAADGSQSLTVSLPAQMRGWLKLPEVTIQTLYPFGLFRAWTYARMEMQCLVYPRPAEAGEPPIKQVHNQNESGQQGVGADDFVGLRGYRDGDSPRHIDWKAHARERGLYSKQFGGDRTQIIRLDWDLLTDPDVEMRLSQLCRFVLLADARKQHYGLYLPGTRIEPGNDPRHKERCLSALARFRVDA